MICPYQDLGDPEEDWCQNPEDCSIYKERVEEKAKRKFYDRSEGEIEMQPNACDEMGNPICLTVSNTADNSDEVASLRAQLQEKDARKEVA